MASDPASGISWKIELNDVPWNDLKAAEEETPQSEAANESGEDHKGTMAKHALPQRLLC